MSDSLDAQLGAAYDNAGGSNVIDTGASITPDDRGGNPSDRALDLADLRDKDDTLTDELREHYDRIDARERAKESRIPKPPPGLNAHQAAEWSWDMANASKSERNLIGSAQTNLQQMIEDAKSMGVSVKLNPDGTIPASELAALRETLGLSGDTGTKPAEVPLADELRQLMPRAKSQQEVAAAIQPYAAFEQDFRTRGAQAFVDAAAQRGVHLADLSNQQHLAHIAAQYYGAPLSVVAELAGYIPGEQVQAIVQHHVSQALEQVHQADAQSTIEQFARGRSDFEQYRRAMGELIQGGAVPEGANMLERAYALAKRNAPGKTKMDRDIEAIADKRYGSAVAA